MARFSETVAATKERYALLIGLDARPGTNLERAQHCMPQVGLPLSRRPSSHGDSARCRRHVARRRQARVGQCSPLCGSVRATTRTSSPGHVPAPLGDANISRLRQHSAGLCARHRRRLEAQRDIAYDGARPIASVSIVRGGPRGDQSLLRSEHDLQRPLLPVADARTTGAVHAPAIAIGGGGEKLTLRIAARSPTSGIRGPPEPRGEDAILAATRGDRARPWSDRISSQAILFLSEDDSCYRRSANIAPAVIVGTPSELTDIVQPTASAHPRTLYPTRWNPASGRNLRPLHWSRTQLR